MSRHEVIGLLAVVAVALSVGVAIWLGWHLLDPNRSKDVNW